MKEFTEGDMLFRFSKGITVCKYDETKFYRSTMLRVEGSKAVDFILIRPGSGLPGDVVFIEVKDLSGHESRNRERLLSGRLASEVAQKVRDTISGLFAAWRWDVQELLPFASALFHKHNPSQIQVVLFLEERKSASLLFPYKRRLADQIQLLNNKLRPFRADCKIYNSKTLPSSHGWKALRRSKLNHDAASGVFE